MATEVAEPPAKTEPLYVPPQVPQAPPEPKLKVKAGDVFRKEFEKLTHPQAEPKAEDAVPTPQEPPSKPPEAPTKPEEPPSKDADAVKPLPTSPLDVVTADVKPEVKVEEPDEFDEKNPDWKRARERIKQQKEEKKALEATISELKKTPKSDPEEITRLAKERDTLKQSLAEREELLQAVDVRLSEGYRTTLAKRDKALSKVVNTAKSYGADADVIIAASALPIGKFRTDQIRAALENVEPEDRTEIRMLLKEVDDRNEELFDFEKDAPKKYEEIQSKREAQLREQQESSVKAIQSEFVKLTETLPNDVVTLREVPDDVPGGTEWNQAIKSARETALRVLSPGGSDFNETGAIALKGAHYDSLMNMFLKDHQELTDARKRLAEFDGGGPDFKGGGKPTSDVKLTPSQKFHKALESIKSVSPD